MSTRRGMSFKRVDYDRSAKTDINGGYRSERLTFFRETKPDLSKRIKTISPKNNINNKMIGEPAVFF